MNGGVRVKVKVLSHLPDRLLAMSVTVTAYNCIASSLLSRPLQLPKIEMKLTHSLSFSASRGPTRTFSPFYTLPERAPNVGLPQEQELHQHHQQPSPHLLQVVLVSPQIPGNTGCIARTCAASGVKLHLVEPLGFRVDDTKLKRAGLDYWPYVVVKVHASWAEFQDYFSHQDGEKRLLAYTKRGTAIHSAW